MDDLVVVVPDDQLGLMFLCCHPAVSADAQVALTLRLLGGLTTEEIARSFLVSEDTMTQRIVRAKRKLRVNHAPYRAPSDADLPDRLHAVLAVISLIFTEGHTATSDDELFRPSLSDEAIRLGRRRSPLSTPMLGHRNPPTGSRLDELSLIEADQLREYQPFHAARADLLARAGRTDDALVADERAIALTTNRAEKDFLDRQRGLLRKRTDHADGRAGATLHS